MVRRPNPSTSDAAALLLYSTGRMDAETMANWVELAQHWLENNSYARIQVLEESTYRTSRTHECATRQIITKIVLSRSKDNVSAARFLHVYSLSHRHCFDTGDVIPQTTELPFLSLSDSLQRLRINQINVPQQLDAGLGH